MSETGLIFIAFGGAGCLVMLFGAVMIRRQAAIKRAIVVTGVVVTNNQVYYGEKTGTRYFPSIRFQTPEGQELHFQSRAGSATPFEVGAAIEVAYLPGRPERAWVQAGGGMCIGVLLFAFGALFAAIGVIVHFAA
jgi:hypothetical protein